MNWWIIAIFVLVLIYVVSPVDAVPDVIPIIGWLDDILLLGLLIYYLKYRRLPRFLTVLKDKLFRNWQAAYRQQQAEQKKGPFENDREYRYDAHRDPYAVLGVRPGASEKEIHAAYRRAVQKYHPDKVTHLGEDFQQLAQKKFVEIQEAYEMLAGNRNN